MAGGRVAAEDLGRVWSDVPATDGGRFDEVAGPWVSGSAASDGLATSATVHVRPEARWLATYRWRSPSAGSRSMS
jgi:hypothetical protein